MSPIQDFYANQVIFLTGVTGFIGKLLVEKLLRSCPNLTKIYVLVRPKHNRTVEQRFDDIFNIECFDDLKSQNPNFFKKIHLLSGDCSKPMVGLDAEAVKILKDEVTCVFHVAANVRFDVDLKSALCTNVRSVRDLLDVAKEMKKLRSFVYVSTAFSHCPRKEIREEFYEVHERPLKLLEMMDCVDEKVFEDATSHFLDKWPNTYVYTKALAEEVIRHYHKDLPISIVRPAIVISCKNEPKPGWIHGFQGLVGIIVAISLGVIRTLPMDKKLKAPLVPADFVVNSILAAAWNTERAKKERDENKISVYNFTGHRSNSITWGWLSDSLERFIFVYSPSKAVWFTFVQHTRFETVHKIRAFLYHTLFAYVVDAVLFIVGNKTLAVEKYTRLNKMINLLSYFTLREWQFDTSNVDAMWDQVDQKDKEMFDFDMKKLKWDDYAENCVVGGRVFLLKDPLETVPKARRKMYLLAVLHYSCIALIIYFLYWLLSGMYKLIF